MSFRWIVSGLLIVCSWCLVAEANQGLPTAFRPTSFSCVNNIDGSKSCIQSSKHGPPKDFVPAWSKECDAARASASEDDHEEAEPWASDMPISVLDIVVAARACQTDGAVKMIQQAAKGNRHGPTGALQSKVWGLFGRAIREDKPQLRNFWAAVVHRSRLQKWLQTPLNDPRSFRHMRTHLFVAAHAGDAAVTSALLFAGASTSKTIFPTKTTPLMVALSQWSDHIILNHKHACAFHDFSSVIHNLILASGPSLLQKDAYGQTALFHAVRDHNLKAIQQMLLLPSQDHVFRDFGLNVEPLQNSKTMLMNAVSLAPLHITTAKWLTQHGGHRVNERPACYYDSLEELGLEALQKASSDMWSYDGSLLRNGLHLWGTQIVSLLLQNGANASLAGKQGNTALHFAAWEGNTASLKVLVDAGAETQKRGANGLLAVDCAAAGGHYEAVQYLKTVGGPPQSACVPGNCPSTFFSASIQEVEFHTKLTNGGWSETCPLKTILSSRCDFDIREDLSEMEFFMHYWKHQQPVLIRRAVQGSKSWSKAQFRKTFGQTRFQSATQTSGGYTESQDTTVADYITMLDSVNKSNYVHAINHTRLLMETRHKAIPKLDKLISETFKNIPFSKFVPKAFQDSGTPHRLNNYQLNIGHPYAGASVHFHQQTTSALLFGRKHWFMFPPSQAFYSTQQIYSWYQESYPKLQTKPLECIQQTGDVIFIPDGWAHGVLYLAESISVSHLYSH